MHPVAQHLPTPPVIPMQETLARRVLTTMFLWVGFGIFLGVLTAPAGRGLIPIIAGAVAGVIVLSPLGIFFGLLGGSRRITLVSGVVGLGLGLGVDLTGVVRDGPSPAAVGLLMGGLIGATVVSLYYRLPRLVLVLVRSHVR